MHSQSSEELDDKIVSKITQGSKELDNKNYQPGYKPPRELGKTLSSTVTRQFIGTNLKRIKGVTNLGQKKPFPQERLSSIPRDGA